MLVLNQVMYLPGFLEQLEVLFRTKSPVTSTKHTLCFYGSPVPRPFYRTPVFAMLQHS